MPGSTRRARRAGSGRPSPGRRSRRRRSGRPPARAAAIRSTYSSRVRDVHPQVRVLGARVLARAGARPRAGPTPSLTSGVPATAAFVIVFSSQSSSPRPFMTSELRPGDRLDVAPAWARRCGRRRPWGRGWSPLTSGPPTWRTMSAKTVVVVTTTTGRPSRRARPSWGRVWPAPGAAGEAAPRRPGPATLGRYSVSRRRVPGRVLSVSARRHGRPGRDRRARCGAGRSGSRSAWRSSW